MKQLVKAVISLPLWISNKIPLYKGVIQAYVLCKCTVNGACFHMLYILANVKAKAILILRAILLPFFISASVCK